MEKNTLCGGEGFGAPGGTVQCRPECDIQQLIKIVLGYIILYYVEEYSR